MPKAGLSVGPRGFKAEEDLHVRGDMLRVTQQKTGWDGDVPIGPELAAALAATTHNHLTFLTTSWGKPCTAALFGNQFREWCNEARLDRRCSSHGLRKAACRRVADAECTAHEIMAISGHITLAEAQRYTKDFARGSWPAPRPKSERKSANLAIGSPKLGDK